VCVCVCVWRLSNGAGWDRHALLLLDQAERVRRDRTVTMPMASVAGTAAGGTQPASDYLRALLGLLARRTMLPAFERFVVRRSG
jgi:hypothetical protein